MDHYHYIPSLKKCTNRISKWSFKLILEELCEDQHDWMNYVELAKFSYDAVIHSVTKQFLFKVAYEVEPFQPIDLVLEKA